MDFSDISRFCLELACELVGSWIHIVCNENPYILHIQILNYGCQIFIQDCYCNQNIGIHVFSFLNG